MMTRKEELEEILGDDLALKPLIDEIIFLENQLTELKKLPFIKVNPKNPMQQKSTPAQKQYKELLQQYANILKIVARSAGEDENDDESPLRKWVKQHVDSG
mgnify:CR=1 FL=1